MSESRNPSPYVICAEVIDHTVIDRVDSTATEALFTLRDEELLHRLNSVCSSRTVCGNNIIWICSTRPLALWFHIRPCLQLRSLEFESQIQGTGERSQYLTTQRPFCQSKIKNNAKKYMAQRKHKYMRQFLRKTEAGKQPYCQRWDWHSTTTKGCSINCSMAVPLWQRKVFGWGVLKALSTVLSSRSFSKVWTPTFACATKHMFCKKTLNKT